MKTNSAALSSPSLSKTPRRRGLSARPRHRAAAALGAAALLLLGAGGASAATDTYNGGSANFFDRVTPAITSGDSLLFTNNGAGTATNDLTGLSVSGLTFNNTASAYTLTGNGIALAGNVIDSAASNEIINLILSGTGGITQSGTGTLTLGSTNTYSGGTTVSSGTLVAENNGSALGTGNISIAGGATLDLDTSGTVYVGATTITGTGTLQKTGTGNEEFGHNGGNVNIALSQGGTIDVEGGTLTGSTFGQGNFTNNLGSLNIASGATFNGVEGTINVDALTGAGTLEGGYGGTRTTTIGDANGSGTFSGIIQNANNGNLALVKTGTGTETLSNHNTFTGGTTVNGGTLALAAGGSTGSVQGAVTVNTGATLSLTAGDALGYASGGAKSRRCMSTAAR